MLLTTKVSQLAADSDKVHAWVHGPASGAGSTVTTDAGVVHSPAKLMADKGAEVTATLNAAIGVNIDAITAVLEDSLAITTVAGIAANVTAVANNNANVTVVAGSIASVNTVAGAVANVNTVAGVTESMVSVVANASNINAVAANGANITAVASNAANINAANGHATTATTQAGLATANGAAQVALATAQAAASLANANAVTAVNTVATTQAGLAAASAASAAMARDLSIAAWSASTAPAEQLAARSQSLHVGTVVKAIVYDTSKDSDGGAWRQRCQDKSWYTEALGGSRWIGQAVNELTARGISAGTTGSEVAIEAAITTAGEASRVSEGVYRIYSSTGVMSSLLLSTTLTIGKTYLCSFVIDSVTTGGGGVAFDQNGVSLGITAKVGVNTISFTATFATLILKRVSGVTDINISSVSVKEVNSAVNVSGAVFQASSTSGTVTSGKYYSLLPTTGVTEVFRGITRDFPAVAGIVAESSRVVIYDLSTGAMWMVFLTTNTQNWLRSSALTSVAALNGEIVIGYVVTNGISIFDLITDAAILRQVGSSAWKAIGRFADRNGGLGLSYTPGLGGLVSASVNDVAITVLDNAPIDPATGLPVPTIAVATAGGLSLLKHDGTVVNQTGTNFKRVAISRSRVYGVRNVSSGVVSDFGPIHLIVDSASSTNSLYRYTALSTPAIAESANAFFTTTKDSLVIAPTDSYPDPKLMILKDAPNSTPNQLNSLTKGMVAYVTNTYNSGWMPGDIRGAYLADTVAEAVTAAALLTGDDSTFTSSTGVWVGHLDAITSVDAGRLKVTSGTSSNSTRYALPVIAGKTYVFTITNEAGTGTSRFYAGSASDYSKPDYVPITAVAGAYSFTFKPSGSFVYIALQSATAIVDGQTAFFDNISVKLAEPDRSVKNRGLVINGTLTKAAVASGAGLVAYSGFSASNYLEQPYNSDLDFGTGDFCVMGWVNLTGVGSTRFLSRTDKTGATFGTNSSFSLMLSAGNWYFQSVAGNWATGAAATTGLHFVALTFSATSLRLYVDNVLVASTTLALNITASGSPSLLLGAGWYNGTIVDAVPGSLALWRISATAPSADQIAHIYRTELPLFQANAQCTLAGTSTAVTALAYDDATELLHVGTSWGRTGFKDLLRVDSEATTTGALTSISAQGGTILTGGTSAQLSSPSIVVRGALKDRAAAARAESKAYVTFDSTATAGQTVITVPKGYTVKKLMKNGVPIREATTGVYWTRSNDGYQEYATLSVGATTGDWLSIDCARA